MKNTNNVNNMSNRVKNDAEFTFTFKSMSEDNPSYDFVSVLSNSHLDFAGDRFIEGCFDDFLKRKTRVPLLIEHDDWLMTGYIDLKIEKGQLIAYCKFFDSVKDSQEWSQVQKYYNGVKCGAINTMSIGCFIKEYRKNDFGGIDILKCNVTEGSIVLSPCNETAEFLSIKSVNPRFNKDSNNSSSNFSNSNLEDKKAELLRRVKSIEEKLN